MRTTIGWTWEPEDERGDIPFAYDFQIVGDYSAGERAVMYDRNGDGYPGSPPEADVLSVELVAVYDDAGQHAASVEADRANIERRFRTAIDESTTLCKKIKDALLEHAAEASEPDADRDYDRWHDEHDSAGLPLEEHP